MIQRPNEIRRSLSRRAAALSTVLLASLPLVGCNKEPKANQNGNQARPAPGEMIPASPNRPAFEFAAGLETEYPAVCSFVNEFLTICLNGDYPAYRKLVTKRREPEPRERFQAIYYSIKRVSIDGITLQHVHDLPEPTYLVKATVSLDPESRVAVRGSNRQIAILAFQENGEWRMAPAPAGLQPGRTGEGPATSSAPADAPTYPWESDGDY